MVIAKVFLQPKKDQGSHTHRKSHMGQVTVEGRSSDIGKNNPNK